MNDNTNGAAPAAPNASAALAATVPFYQSQVVIGAIISAISVMLALFGLPAIGVTDQDILTKAVMAIGGGAGALLSVIGRIRTQGARPLSLGSVKGVGTAAALMLAVGMSGTLSGCAVGTIEHRLDQAGVVLATGDALIDAAVLTGAIDNQTADAIRVRLRQARAAIALARAALAVGNSTEAQAQADAALQAAQDAEQLLRNSAPPAGQPTPLQNDVAAIRGEAEQLAANARR